MKNKPQGIHISRKSKKWGIHSPGRSRKGRFYPLLALLTLLGFHFFSVCQFCCYSEELPPASAFQVYRDPVVSGPRITSYLRYQLDRAWQQDEKRLQQWASIRTKMELGTLQQQTRGKLLDLLGGLPNVKTPLNPKITGQVAGDGFRIEKIIFESLPHFYVTALLYLPEKIAGPSPAVLVPCGHSQNGKIYYQLLCQRLAKQGYVVICWDPVGQGERSQFWDSTVGKSRYNLVCGEHAVLGNLAYLAGANLARWEIWDGMRALDYLLTRPEVDSKRISITGTSGGGFQVAHIAALDERIQAVAPSCYISSLPMRMANRIFKDPDSDPEQDIYRMVESGIDHPGLMLLIYPRPLILAAAVEDFFPIEGARRSFREIAALYRRFGLGARIELVEGYHPHRFSDENQLAVINFLDRFSGQPSVSSLPAVAPLPEKELLCTRSGQVSLEFSDARPMTDFIRRRFEENQGKERIKIATLYRSGLYPGIQNWPVIPDEGDSSSQKICWKKIGNVESGVWQWDQYQLRHSTRLRIPLVHIHARNGGKGRLVFWIKENGKANSQDWPAILSLLQKGMEVVSYDFRGQGEDSMAYSTTGVDAASGGSAGMIKYDDPLNSVLADYVYNSLLIGRPYFLEMLEDTEIVRRFVEVQLKPGELWICAGGEAAPLARAIHEVFQDIKLHPDSAPGGVTWSRLVMDKQEQWPIQFLLPGGAWVE